MRASSIPFNGLAMTESKVLEAIRHNCNISDARDNGIYSICALVLKLRNLYKWEHAVEPWHEPETADLLDWIEEKENYWETLAGESYVPLPLNGKEIDPFDEKEVNMQLGEPDLFYGAGYGRSLKSIFFLAEKIREDSVEGCPVVILGKEKVKELSSPFAMLQDGVITLRREPLRFFFWDQIQELRSSSKVSVYHALNHYGILTDGVLDQDCFRDRLETIVDAEIPMFLYHEVGEMLQHTFDSTTLQKIISTFPDSAIEFVCRAVKDVLADTHPSGMISYIIREQKDASLGFYVGFLAGLRRVLFPEISDAFDRFLKTPDWSVIESARSTCRDNNRSLAETIRSLADRLDYEDAEQVKFRFNEEVLLSLGLEIPDQKG